MLYLCSTFQDTHSAYMYFCAGELAQYRKGNTESLAQKPLRANLTLCIKGVYGYHY